MLPGDLERRGRSERHGRAGRALAVGALLALLAAGPGCLVAQYREGNPVPLDQVDRIRPGVTTKEEVLAWFGPPQNYTNASLLEQLVASDEVPPGTTPPYRFSDVLAYQIHHGEVRGLLLLLFNRIDVRMRSDHLVVFFDEDDVVRYYGVRRAEDP